MHRSEIAESLPVDFSLLGRNGKPYNARNEHIRV